MPCFSIPFSIALLGLIEKGFFVLKISSIGFVDAVLRHGKSSFILCGSLYSIALGFSEVRGNSVV